MRTLLVKCVCLGLALGSVADEACSISDACAAEDGLDEVSLLQKPVREHTVELLQKEAQTFPDFGALGDLAKKIPGVNKLVNKAEDTLQSGSTFTLKTLGETINNTLNTLDMEVDAYARIVDENKNDTSNGIASILAKTLNVPLDSISVGPMEEMQAKTTLAKALSIWTMVQTSGSSGSAALASGLETVGFKDAAKQFNTSVQKALEQGEELADSLRSIQASLEKGNDAALLQFSIFGYTLWGEDVTQKMSKALKDAHKKVATFPEDFSDAFSFLENKVDELLTGKVSEAQAEEVQKSFDSVHHQATALAQKMSSTTVTLLDSLGSGLDTVERAAGRSHARGVLPSVALLAAALASLV